MTILAPGRPCMHFTPHRDFSLAGAPPCETAADLTTSNGCDILFHSFSLYISIPHLVMIRRTLLLYWNLVLPFCAGFSTTTTKATSLLDLEQYAAQARRAEVERVLMLDADGLPPPELAAVTFKDGKNKKKGGGGGGGFGSSGGSKKWSKEKELAKLQKKLLEKDGVIRINDALSADACHDLREHILQEVEATALLYSAAKESPDDTSFVDSDYYGIEPTRPFRTDLLLSLLPEPVSNALTELFNESNGKLRHLYEDLVTADGVMYELAGVVTSPGSERQCVHPDLPFQTPAPLYVVFLALQDVTSDMGPTTFLRGSNSVAARDAFASNTKDALDELIADADIIQTTMKAGDLVVFDARTLHCGNANVHESMDRALFNFSFRNPSVKGPLGYKGSMRPDYTKQQITLGRLLSDIDKENVGQAFFEYGDGLPKSAE